MISEIRAVSRAIKRLPVGTRDLVSMGTLSLATIFAESFGLSLLYPLLLYLQSGPQEMLANTPWPLNRLFDFLDEIGLGITLGSLIGLIVTPFVLRSLLTYFRTVYMGHLVQRTTTRLREQAFDTSMASDFAFHLNTNRSVLTTNIYSEPGRIGALVHYTGDLAVQLLLALGCFCLLIYTSWELSLLAVPVILIVTILYRFQMTKARRAGEAITESIHTLYHRLNESLQGIRLIKASNMEAQSSREFSESANYVRTSTLRQIKLQASVSLIIYPTMFFSGGVLIYLAVGVFDFSSGILGAYIIIFMRMIPVVIQINTGRTYINSFLPAIDSFYRFVDSAAATTTLRSGKIPYRGLIGNLRFENVQFSYFSQDGRVFALQDVSLEIPKGETIAIVGRSGAGKSTIADLIMRLYDPTGGEIWLGDHLLWDYNPVSLRRKIKAVYQDTFMFDRTIRQNIEYGLDVPLDEGTIAKVLKDSHCSEFIESLPQGLETLVGERGVRLSGGQRQRLSLARALAQSPDLLILDEPTSALDSVSEAEIQGALQGLHGQITMVVIAHRLATIKNADRIFVIDKGRIVASGTHAHLVETECVYSELFATQMQA